MREVRNSTKGLIMFIVLLKRYGLLPVAKFETLKEAEAYTKHDEDLYEIQEAEDENNVLDTGGKEEIITAIKNLRVALDTVGGTSEADCARKVSDILLTGIYRVLSKSHIEQRLGDLFNEIYEMREDYWRNQNDSKIRR